MSSPPRRPRWRIDPLRSQLVDSTSDNSKLERRLFLGPIEGVMTEEKVLETVAAMPAAERRTIQTGIADLISSRFSKEEHIDILAAQKESEAECARGEGFLGDEVRRQLDLA